MLRALASRALRRRPFPYPTDFAASAMALLYLMGGLTTLLVLVAPHPSTVNEAVLLVIGGSAPVVAVVVHLSRRRLPPAAHPWLLAAGTVIVTTLVATAGSVSVAVSFSFYYLWIVLYALLFLTPLAAIIQIGVATGAYFSAITTLQTSPAVAVTALEPLVLIAVLATTGIIVAGLSRARERSEIDALTGMANRRGLDRMLTAAVEQAPHAAQTLVAAMIDVDHFKTINDRDGHAAGDAVLEQLAQSWRPVLRAGDCMGRFGGDEFVVLLPGCSWSDADGILHRLRTVTPQGVTCSVGAALWQPGDSVSMLLSHADSALYDAKRLGRNRLVWASVT